MQEEHDWAEGSYSSRYQYHRMTIGSHNTKQLLTFLSALTERILKVDIATSRPSWTKHFGHCHPLWNNVYSNTVFSYNIVLSDIGKFSFNHISFKFQKIKIRSSGIISSFMFTFFSLKILFLMRSNEKMFYPLHAIGCIFHW